MKKIIFLVLVISTLNIFSQDYAKVHTLIIEGIDATYHIDFDKALSKFQEARRVVPSDLRGQFFETTVYFWRGMFARSRPDYETYLNLSDKLVEKCEDIVDKNENDLDARLYLGWCYTMRAFILYYMDQNVLRGASEIKDGNKHLTFVVEKKPDYYDAYLGLGIFNYMTSLIPRKLQWLTNVLGFSGDRETGYTQLKTASDKGVYTSNEAKFYLTLLSWREEKFTEAESYATGLKNSYPNSPAVWMVWGLLMSQQDKMSEAIQAYEKSIELNSAMKSDIVYKTGYGALANAYFRTNNFDKAVEFGKKYMNYVNKDDRYNNRLYSIGVSLDLLGKKDEAQTYYKQARTEQNKDAEWEKYWHRKLTDRINNPTTVIDSLLITADNNRAVGKLNEALNDYNKLKPLIEQKKTDDLVVQLNLGYGHVYLKQKDFNKAIESFKQNLNLSPQNEKWLVPESYFQIGRCYLRLGNKSEAQKYFDMALEIDYEFDFKDALDQKIKNELSKAN